MIQEPARVQATTYEARAPPSNNQAPEQASEHAHARSQDPQIVTVTIPSGERNSSPNCCCSHRRTTQTVPTKASVTCTSMSSTTIPIVINTKPNPRIILIRVPTQAQTHETSNSNSSKNSCNNSRSSGTECSAPRTRIIRIPFLPGSVPTRPPVKRALPTVLPLVNLKNSATEAPIATYPATGTATYQLEHSSAQAPRTLHHEQATVVGTRTMEMVTQTVPVSSTPQSQTLASMAGIQLTGADLQPSRQDMSGAMPTATVEEIDVPVFIDEYLQDIEATSSCSSESGKEIFTETDILDFDFDINLIAEDHIELEPKKMDRCNLVMDDINNDNLDDYKLQMDDYDFQQLTGEEETLDMAPMCGINFNQPNNFIDLNDILTGSQDPMLSTFSQTSTNTKCFSEEPLLADENSYGGSMYVCSQESLGFGQVDDVKPATDPEVGGSSVSVAIRHTLSNPLVGLKRTASAAVLAPAGETQAQKRSKLMLKINSQSPPAFSQSEEISTPAIIEQVLNFERPEAANTTIITSHAGIIEDLRSAEEETTTDFSAPNTPHSYYSACSSSVAPTCQSGFGGFLTAPASPAYSVASTSQFSATTSTNGNAPKRKRGRPAKEHADGPDPEVMSRMDDEKRKAYIDRIKNNEASRVSRRKTKSRDELEKQLEEELVAENESLLTQSQRVDHKETLFKNYLMVRQRNNSTFVKKEH
ncbi:uncharacterized protein LOC6588102 [Drosophila persimilis]|uniref:uncharacterized protein LOC113564886 n=1 Tax=Drosophila persimilis TaxID=7234 RepID=UPI000F08E12A|nr:uncharacterized protein LOC113564886 [Drosophila persimilis]XP_026842922.1 uncharacterized protein LOC6588102 [Drosophila persimilis]